MEIKITLIRNGYIKNPPDMLIGVTDKPLGEDGRTLVQKRKDSGIYPDADLVYSSGLSRCVETARIIYPAGMVVVENALNAPDYGIFEGKTHGELESDERFIRWGSPHVPQSGAGIEEAHAVSARSTAAFRRICDKMASSGVERISVITHKAIIEAILRRYMIPRNAYADTAVPPAGGYVLDYNTITAALEIKGEF